MDWWELVKEFAPYLFTLIVLIFGLGLYIKKIAAAFGATGTATIEAGDFLQSIRAMLEDGTITDEELDVAMKEWKEMVEAGKVAVDAWRGVFMEILLKIRGKK